MIWQGWCWAVGLPELPKFFLTLSLRSNGSFPGAQADKSCPLLPELSLTGTTWVPGVPGGSVGLQGSKELIWGEQVRRRARKGVPVTFLERCGSTLCCSIGEERNWSVGGAVLLLGFQVRQRMYRLFRGLGRYRGVRSEPSPVRSFSRRAEELFQKVPGETEGEPSNRAQTHLGLFVTKDIRESVWTVSLRVIPPKSAAWGSQQVRRGHSAVGCLCQAPLPVPMAVMAAQREQRLPILPALQQGSHAKQRDLGLMQGTLRFSSFLSVIWSCFLQIFSRFVRATSFVQVFCPNQVHVGRMIGSSQFDSWPGTLQKSTFWLPWLCPFLGNDHTSLGSLVCSYLPHPAVLGVPAARIWLGQLLAKLSLVHLITGRGCMGWDYAFSCHKRAFCLKKTQGMEHEDISKPSNKFYYAQLCWFVPTPVPSMLAHRHGAEPASHWTASNLFFSTDGLSIFDLHVCQVPRGSAGHNVFIDCWSGPEFVIWDDHLWQF